MNKQKHFSRSFAAAFALLALSACDMYAPSNLNQNRIQVAEENITEDIVVSEMTDERIAALANEYNNNGGSPMNVVLTYDPKSYRNTAMIAGDNAAKIAKTLRAQGVQDVQASILPVIAQGDEGRVMVSYRAVTANAPEGCKDMPGMESSKLQFDPDYKLGCGVETLIAKQISRPSDLLGRGNTDASTDGRSASNIIEVYRTGAPNAPLKGESASGTAD